MSTGVLKPMLDSLIIARPSDPSTNLITFDPSTNRYHIIAKHTDISLIVTAKIFTSPDLFLPFDYIISDSINPDISGTLVSKVGEESTTNIISLTSSNTIRIDIIDQMELDEAKLNYDANSFWDRDASYNPSDFLNTYRLDVDKPLEDGSVPLNVSSIVKMFSHTNANGTGKQYTFNESTSYIPDISWSLTTTSTAARKTYTLTEIPLGYPLAIINTSPDISYNLDPSNAPIYLDIQEPSEGQEDSGYTLIVHEGMFKGDTVGELMRGGKYLIRNNT